MAILIPESRLRINRNGTFTSPLISLNPKTAQLALVINRPDGVNGLTWAQDSLLSTNIIVRAGTEDHICSGAARGGMASGFSNVYRLAFTPLWGFFGSTSGFPRRLGEEKTSIEVQVELSLRGGLIDTSWWLEVIEEDAPRDEFHSSVAFNASSSGLEDNGDGVLSVSHNAGTGSDKCAFAGVGSADTGASGTLGSATYDGNSMTEHWDQIDTVTNFLSCAGYTHINPLNGNKTCTSTLVSSTPDSQFLCVMSFNGVHQTTPAGTPTVVGNLDCSNDPSATVSTPASDSMIVDVLSSRSTNSLTVGANQTQRETQSSAFPLEYRASTQSGADGGVMSWTRSPAGATYHNQIIGAMEIKAAAVGGGGFGSRPLLTLGVGA